MKAEFRVGDPVRCIKPSLESYGLIGKITKLKVSRFPDAVWVMFDIWHGETNKELYFNRCNLEKVKESECVNMARLDGYKAVAVIEQDNSYHGKKDYYYAIYNDGFEYDRYDNVLVSGANREVLMIKDIITPEEAKERGRKDITAEVICKVDFSEYNKRVEERKEAEERKKEVNKIKRQMDKMVEEMDKNKMYESYAKFNPELAAKLKEYKELLGE